MKQLKLGMVLSYQADKSVIARANDICAGKRATGLWPLERFSLSQRLRPYRDHVD
jgi:hypothetical protein